MLKPRQSSLASWAATWMCAVLSSTFTSCQDALLSNWQVALNSGVRGAVLRAVVSRSDQQAFAWIKGRGVFGARRGILQQTKPSEVSKSIIDREPNDIDIVDPPGFGKSLIVDPDGSGLELYAPPTEAEPSWRPTHYLPHPLVSSQGRGKASNNGKMYAGAYGWYGNGYVGVAETSAVDCITAEFLVKQPQFADSGRRTGIPRRDLGGIKDICSPFAVDWSANDELLLIAGVQSSNELSNARHWRKETEIKDPPPCRHYLQVWRLSGASTLEITFPQSLSK